MFKMSGVFQKKLMIAIQEHRRLLMTTGVVGLKIVGPGKYRDTMLVRETLSVAAAF